MESGRFAARVMRIADVVRVFDAGTRVDFARGMAKPRKRSETATSTPVEMPDQGSNGDAPAGDSRDRIAARAYELYLARGGRDGADFDDWIAAERELAGSSAHAGSDRGV